MPNVPTYIREEDYPLYLEAKKNGWSEFIHAALNNLDYKTLPSVNAPEPTHAPIPSKVAQKKDPVEAVPKLKVMTNNDLKELLGASGKQPITSEPTHVCKDNCKHWVWDVDKGGRVNSITGEFQEGSPW